MSKVFYKNMDPLEIESRFSNERAFFYDQEESSFCYEDFKPFISRLPQREIDLIDMYYREEKKQKEIAEFFGVTQGAISHRLSRACKRLEFLRDMPKVTGSLNDLLRAHFNTFEIDIIMLMISTTCQSKTASLLNKKHKLEGNEKMTQVKVRHKFDRFIERVEKLKKVNSEFSVCLNLMNYVKNNLYMLHEVILPHFDRGYHIRIDKIC
jgi:predicted XRE-type DNA-binding protein